MTCILVREFGDAELGVKRSQVQILSFASFGYLIVAQYSCFNATAAEFRVMAGRAFRISVSS
jgi:hypothetical protein